MKIITRIYFLIIIVTICFSCKPRKENISLEMKYDMNTCLLTISVQNNMNKAIYIPLEKHLIFYTNVLFKDMQGEYIQFGDDLLETIISTYEKEPKSLNLTSIIDSLKFTSESDLSDRNLREQFINEIIHTPDSNYLNTAGQCSIFSKHCYFIKSNNSFKEQLSLQSLLSQLRKVYPEYGLNEVRLLFNIKIKGLIDEVIFYPKVYQDFSLYDGPVYGKSLDIHFKSMK